MKMVGPFNVSQSLKEYLMISFHIRHRRYAIAGMSLFATIIGGTYLSETMLADIVIGTPDYVCKEEIDDPSKCAYNSSNDCPLTIPPPVGTIFYCSEYHIPKVCVFKLDSTCREFFDLQSCGNKRDCANNQDVLDSMGKPIKCNQTPKDCQ